MGAISPFSFVLKLFTQLTILSSLNSIFMNIFNDYKSEKPKSTVLAVGSHIVGLIKIFLIDSFTNLNGSAKDDSAWSEPTQQLAVTVGNDKGVITTRLNGRGYMHTDSVDADYLEKNGLVDVDGYVAKELKNGKFERIDSEENTEACTNILNRFFHACAVPEGTTLEELMQLAKDNNIQLEVEVKSAEYDGKTHNEVKGFKQVTTDVPVTPELA